MRFVSGYSPTEQYWTQRADMYPVSPSTHDDEFAGSSLSTEWIWVKQGGWTTTVRDGSLFVHGPEADGADVQGLVKAVPSSSAPWAFACKAWPNPTGDIATAPMFGLVIAESTSPTSGALRYVGMYTGSHLRGISHTTWNSGAGAWGSQWDIAPDSFNRPFWARIDMSTEGYYTASIGQDPSGAGRYVASENTITPAYVGLLFSGNGQWEQTVRFDWFRRIY